MLRDEAEREAERRNHEDPDRARYEYYAFDESAGMADDAWEVSARLRQGPSSTSDWPGIGPQTPAAGAPEPEVPPPPEATAPPLPEPTEEPLILGGPTLAEIDPFAGPDPFVEPLPYEQEIPVAEPEPRDGRAGWFVRSVGVAVVLAGMAWIALIIVLTVTLKPNSSTSVTVFVLVGALGLLAILLGALILRS